MEELTKKQKRVLDFIVEQIRLNGSPPTIREIGKHFGFSALEGPRVHLRALAKKGYIRLKKGISRGIELLVPAFGIPILGRISAGKPSEAIENIEGYIDLSRIFKEKNLFALKVKGDSMEGEGIKEGDLAIVRKQSLANNGDIVVALIEDEALVKKFYKDKNGIRLEAGNPKYSPILTQKAEIIGKVIKILRDYEALK